MKNKILLTETEKERILGLHKKAIKESRLNEGDGVINPDDPYDYKFDEKYLKGTSTEREYTSNPNNYPTCVRTMGTPMAVTSGNKSSRYAIKGTGSAKFLTTNEEISFDKFFFFPIPYEYNEGGVLVQQKNKPNPKAFNSINSQYEEYFCSTNNQIQIGDVTYVPISKPSSLPKPQRTIPTTGDQLLKGGTYLMLKDKNDLVTQVQSQLIYAGENVQKTGTFDQQTKDAVKSYQGKNNLKPDGIVGKLTWGKLSKVLPFSDETMARKEFTQIPTSSTPKELVPLTPSQPVAQDNTSVEY